MLLDRAECWKSHSWWTGSHRCNGSWDWVVLRRSHAQTLLYVQTKQQEQPNRMFSSFLRSVANANHPLPSPVSVTWISFWVFSSSFSHCRPLLHSSFNLCSLRALDAISLKKRAGQRVRMYTATVGTRPANRTSFCLWLTAFRTQWATSTGSRPAAVVLSITGRAEGKGQRRRRVKERKCRETQSSTD